MNREGLSPHARAVLIGKRQCIGTNRNGERCGKTAMIGLFVCAFHGGKSPLSRQAAQEFLNTLREPALEVIYRATRNAPPCKVCGRSDADRDPTAVRAAFGVLDRTGLGIGQQGSGAAPGEYFAWIPAERFALITQWIAEAKEAMQAGEPQPEQRQLPERSDAVPVDGEEVEP